MDVDHEARRLVAVLAARHPLFRPRTIDRLVRRIFDEFADSPVRTYLPVLVQREAERRLRDLDHDFPARPLRPPRAETGLPVVPEARHP
ncbi:three-helix bundle dimerization domain-containing protein [Kineosporia sp. A_224]|uniref:three-helix bundle dimerization domain-containing protein n=1 Tax=Kineosporia sp. A_224 TaxID=1962180 RepID=UPI000B4BA5FC|nr:hypothetical protein [Kineosporia sp. A_224]